LIIGTGAGVGSGVGWFEQWNRTDLKVGVVEGTGLQPAGNSPGATGEELAGLPAHSPPTYASTLPPEVHEVPVYLKLMFNDFCGMHLPVSHFSSNGWPLQSVDAYKLSVNCAPETPLIEHANTKETASTLSQ
jgi:hypothetical protein